MYEYRVHGGLVEAFDQIIDRGLRVSILQLELLEAPVVNNCLPVARALSLPQEHHSG